MTNFSGKPLSSKTANAACGGPQGGGMDSRRNGVAEVSPKYLADIATNGVPVGYKQTDVGVIPEDWELKYLGEICNFENGDRSSNYPSAHEFSNSGIPFINAGHVSEGKIDLADMDYIPTHVYERLGGGKVKSGDLVYCLRGSLGKFGVISDDFGLGAVASSLVIVRPKKSTTTKFVSAYFKSNIAKNMISLWAGGAAQPNLGAKELANFLVPLPDSQEQTAIANALSDVDALISELEKLIAKKQAIKTATMQQLLTGRTRLPQFALREDGTPKGTKPSELGEIPEDWECISIGRDTVLKARIGWQALTTKEYQTTGDIYLVTGTDFDSGAVKWERCFYVSEWRYKQDQNIQLRNDDVLITKDGTIGKVGYVTALSRPATLNSGVFVVRPKNNNLMQRFLFYVLTSRVFDDFINRITAGSTITHLYQKDFVNFEFSAPCIEEQTAIATILSDMDEEIQALEQRLGKTRQIKQGMMQELLTGKTRLLQPLNKESQHG